MSVDYLLTQEVSLCKIPAISRKRVLQEISRTLASDEISEDQLFDDLMARERLGSTSIGEGVAIPHCRANVERMQICLVTTEAPVDYEADDAQLVDIFVTLIVPTDEHEIHLSALAQFSRALAPAESRTALRACNTSNELFECMRTLLRQT